ncbi:5'-3' exonuclease [Paenibacillus radicis (ex Gao et al. 2016)]|uniref:5'-3' exonuclease n=1 Tax=Paenibacillus radicis (ex Gao et al. 2016) TaxID=1737354 RepID=A0A917LQR2_9BACL|nr:5'-3' exonuclease H3TH domain-containing protein [Paenibacillus radicis (ex Gao et al. 2016)]GGG51443.1 5'-3' exonuclease [Paenibacillus radicis (ex Gao et al. 2016)]
MNNNKVLIVDGMAVLFRAFYATSYSGYIRKTSAGLPTNAIYGFIQYFFDAITTFQPTHVICCWDMGSKTFRTEQFADYKGNRGEPPLELIPQFDLVKEVVAEMGIPNVGIVGYEADDCIGTLSKQLRDEAEVYILTGDHDMLQLVSDKVKVVIMKKGKLNYAVYDLAYLLEDKQLAPHQIIDIKGFMGDTSDNYPGVKGIGEKTALKLLLDYDTVEGVLENLDKLPKGVRTKIEANLDMLHLSRDLATIRLDTPVACGLTECVWELQLEAAVRKFEELEFGGLVKLLESHAKTIEVDLFTI